MGPLASAEFVKTIYEHNMRSPEQECPSVILVSDPAIPDRTTSLLNGSDDVLLERVRSGIDLLTGSGATRIIVCCVTAHPILSRLPLSLQERTISLVDVIFSSICNTTERYLLLCTQGTRATGIFQHHQSWPGVRSRITLPDEGDQALVHSLIYDIKKNVKSIQQLELVEGLLKKYQVNSYIAACTELHILAKDHIRLNSGKSRELCIDPLTIIASNMLPCSNSDIDASIPRQHLSYSR